MVKVGLRLSVQLTSIEILHQKIIARFLVWYEKSFGREIVVAEPVLHRGNPSPLYTNLLTLISNR